jgi:hypothetical protein
MFRQARSLLQLGTRYCSNLPKTSNHKYVTKLGKDLTAGDIVKGENIKILVNNHIKLNIFLMCQTQNSYEDNNYYNGQVLDDQLNDTGFTSNVRVGEWSRDRLERQFGNIVNGSISYYSVLVNNNKPYEYKEVKYQKLNMGDIIMEPICKTLKSCHLKLTKPMMKRCPGDKQKKLLTCDEHMYMVDILDLDTMTYLNDHTTIPIKDTYHQDNPDVVLAEKKYDYEVLVNHSD